MQEAPVDWGPMQVFRVFWGNVDLGWADTMKHAEGVVNQHIAGRQRRGGQRNSRATMRAEYRIEPETLS